MKKVLLMFLLIAAGYIVFIQPNLFAWWPMGETATEEKVTSRINTIEVNVAGAHTVIVPDDRDDVVAELDGKGEVKVKKDGDKISVTYKRNLLRDGISLVNKTKLTVYIPENFDRKLAYEIGSGHLEFEGNSKNNPFEVEELSVEVGSGNVMLKNIETDLFVQDVASGNIYVESVTAKNGKFDISSGNLEMVRYEGRLEADVSSGNLDIQMDELVAPIEMEVSSGMVTLDLPKNADFKLNGEISSGTIDTDFSLKNETNNRNEIKGTHGSGKNPIGLEVSSGKVDIH